MNNEHIRQQIMAEYPNLETVIGRERAKQELDYQLGRLVAQQLLDPAEALEVRRVL